MVTFPHEDDAPTAPRGRTPGRRGPRTARRAAARNAAALVAMAGALGLVTACGTDSGNSASSPQTLSGTARPASGDSTAPSGGAATASQDGGTASDSSSAGSTATAKSSGSPDSTGASASTDSSGSSTDVTRCHTSELSASLGSNNPGAGQENFPIVLTNTSSHTCTLRGYPGVAFVDGSGKQLGPDPVRSEATKQTVTLTPGDSAWAGLSFSNPEVSGAQATTPATLVVTPPDEEDHLMVPWTGGEVPVSGNASSVKLTTFSAGTGG
jgi:hypothetical protein